MKLYLLRHGETSWNVECKVQGASDIPLNDNGIRMAKQNALAMVKAGMTFDKIYVSPKIRARQTATFVADALGMEMTAHPLLSEIDFGEYEGQVEEELQKSF